MLPLQDPLPILQRAGQTGQLLEQLSSQQAVCAATAPLPMTGAEMRDRGWDQVDVVFVSGDAYVDHPSFAMAILGRILEAAGFRVGMLSQPDWRSCEAWREFGRPRLFYAISAGNMDSMINHYTANRKVRNDDAYSPGGRIGLRPDRATLAYCQRAREAYRGVPVIAGGVEASLRRLAHYDYWGDKVRRSILLDCKADLLAFGMGEELILEIARRLDAGQTPRELRDMRGVAYAMGASETPPEDALTLPSYEDVLADKMAFARATKMIHNETNPYNARRLIQWHDRQAVVANPPTLPISEGSMDAVYGLPYTRRPHPSYSEPIPAFEMIKDSVTIMRGCFGGCTFCSITMHQGRAIQSRSPDSILREVEGLRFFDEEGDVFVGGDQQFVAVHRGWDAQIDRIQVFLVEHLVVLGIGGLWFVDGGLCLQGLFAHVAKGLEDDLAFLGEGGEGGQMRVFRDEAKADTADADGCHRVFLLRGYRVDAGDEFGRQMAAVGNGGRSFKFCCIGSTGEDHRDLRVGE